MSRQIRDGWYLDSHHRHPFALVLFLALGLAACAAPTGSPGGAAPGAGATGGGVAGERPLPAIAPGTRLSIATGGTGGVYFPIGGGLAQLLQTHLGVQATAEVTPASVDNMKLLLDNPKDMVAFTLADTAYDALKGRERLAETGPIPVRSLGIIYSNFTHLVALEGSGIDSLRDLRGKRVSVGAAGSGTETIANRLLETAGLNPASDIQRERLGAVESAGALKDRRLDAFFWSGGLPTGAITDLASTPGLTIKLISEAEAVPAMNRGYGQFYVEATIPRDVYRLSADVRVSGLPNILAVHQDFPEELAYGILKTIADKRSDWDAIHPEAKNLALDTAWADNPVPLHPGAVRFYRDLGVYRGN
jgi:TRAP transporter TAXI family solute receptor